MLSAPHTWFRSGGLKCRFRRFSATGKESLLLVGDRNLRLGFTCKPPTTSPLYPPYHGELAPSGGTCASRGGLAPIHGPTHYRAQTQTQHHRQVQPTSVGPQANAICAPHLVPLGRVEMPVPQVLCHGEGIFAVGRRPESAPGFYL